MEKRLIMNLCNKPFEFVFNPNTILSTVKPDCEQRPPVNNGQFEPSTASLNLSFIRHLCQTAAFFRPQGWPLYTGLTVCLKKINLLFKEKLVRSA